MIFKLAINNRVRITFGKILRSELGKYGVVVEFGFELKTLENTGDHVKVKLQKANGKVEEASYNYVMGGVARRAPCENSWAS